MAKVYIVRFANGRVNHACQSKHQALGGFELDRIFGGGFQIPCGKACEGEGTLSEEPKDANTWVTCTGCRKKLKMAPKADTGNVPWRTTRAMDKPRILGIPG